MELSHKFIELIRCPVSGGKLDYDRRRGVLLSRDAGLEYPIIDGVPLLLKSESKKISEDAETDSEEQVLEENTLEEA